MPLRMRQEPRRPPPDFQYETFATVHVDERGEDVVFSRRRRVHRRGLRLVLSRDLRECVALVFYALVALLLPSSRWGAVCHWVAGIRAKKERRRDFDGFARAVEACLGSGADIEALFRQRLDAVQRRFMLVAVHLVRPGWKPVFTIEGQDGLKAALARGNGAILWCDQFASQTVMGKRALREAGFATAQVSMSDHGSNRSRLSRHVLNRPLIHVENRFLRERLVFEGEDTVQLTRRMRKALGGNGVVLMTNSTNAGSIFAQAAFGPRARIRFATGPANFAARGRTALFSMATFETVPFREYRVVLGPPLAPADGGPGRSGAKDLDAMAGLILSKRDHMLAAVRRCPGQLLYWPSAPRQEGEGPGPD